MRRKLRRVLFLIMTVIITFVGCGESNKTKTVDKKASIATEDLYVVSHVCTRRNE